MGLLEGCEDRVEVESGAAAQVRGWRALSPETDN